MAQNPGDDSVRAEPEKDRSSVDPVNDYYVAWRLGRELQAHESPYVASDVLLPFVPPGGRSNLCAIIGGSQMPALVSNDDLTASIASKVRRRVLPLLMAGWFVAYIDRFNVSYAALQMNKDLGLSPTIFGLGSGLFFLGYALFEVPSNLILSRVGARRWLGRIMITWGLVTAATAWTQGPSSFAALRLLLGIAEAGCFPGMAFCLSQWLTPRDRAAALAALGGITMASAIVGGPLAAALLALNGQGGLAGWQWLFLIEAVPAVLVGIAVWRYLPDSPERALWLTPAEREWLAAREPHIETRPRITDTLLVVVANPRYWTWGTAFFCATAAGSATLLFRPTILQAMTGLSATLTAVFTAVPSVVGMVVIVVVGRRSTRMDERRWHAVIPLLIGAVGVGAAGIAYGLFPALAVASLSTVAAAAQPPLFAAVSAEAKGEVNAAGIAFVNSIASLGGFLGPYAMGALMDWTGSLVVPCAVAGLVIVAGACLIAAVRPRTATSSSLAAGAAVSPA